MKRGIILGVGALIFEGVWTGIESSTGAPDTTGSIVLVLHG